MRILVVYYSRTGTTARVAEQVARRLDADLECIGDRTPRDGWRGWLRCAYEAMRARTGPVSSSGRDPSRYDLVVIGTPIWGGVLATPVRSWIARHHEVLDDLGMFCTCGASDGERAIAELTRLAGTPPRAALVLRHDQLRRGVPVEALDVFAAALAPPPPPPARPAWTARPDAQPRA
ncbi:MAG: flavodoxin [Deltaproteobacteria bacterium]|nr:flavodoxin [Deltaproteobacteria bacterium]